MAKNRKMSEAEIDDYISNIQNVMTSSLDAVKAIMPEGYHLTLVARLPGNTNADLIMSNDPDQKAVAEAVLNNGNKAVK